VYEGTPPLPIIVTDPFACVEHKGLLAFTVSVSGGLPQAPVTTLIEVLNALGPVMTQLPVGGVVGDIL
jgi:hypothetical protein